MQAIILELYLYIYLAEAIQLYYVHIYLVAIALYQCEKCTMRIPLKLAARLLSLFLTSLSLSFVAGHLTSGVAEKLTKTADRIL